jgi:hypothetical protein
MEGIEMNQPINDGGPAFPHLETTSRGEPYHDHLGMTLRDYFAAAALRGILSNTEASKAWNESDVARFCYFQSDAMLKARQVKP